MIFNYNDPIFNGEVEKDPDNWVSMYPRFDDIIEDIKSNPNTAKDLGFKLSNLGFPEITNQGKSINYIGRLGLKTGVTACRQSIGDIATEIGFLSSEIPNLENIYLEDTYDITKAFNAVDLILDSAPLNEGLNAIGAIPIVGWIIKAVAEIAKAITFGVLSYIEGQDNAAKKELSSQNSVLIQDFNKELDQAVARECLFKLRDRDYQWLISPRGKIDNIKDFYIFRGKLKKNDELTKMYYIYGDKNETETYGLGFIPGTRNINDGMGIYSTGCQTPVFDTGIYYPTASTIGNNFWSILQKNGPLMYTVDTNKAIDDWKNYIYWLFRFGIESIQKGWSCNPTGIINTNKYLCFSGTKGYYFNNNDSECKKLRYNKELTIPVGLNNYEQYKKFLTKTFFPGNLPLFDKNKGADPENVDYDQSIPVQNLINQFERADAYLDTINCMYVNDSFAGIQKAFKSKWASNVTEVINSNLWKKVSFIDMPDGEVKDIIYQKCSDNNVDCNNLGKMASFDLMGTGLGGDQVRPPNPFAPVDVQVTTLKLPDYIKNRNNVGSGNKMLVLGGLALGLGYMLTRKG